MNRAAFLSLVDKISSGNATDAEIARYNAWYDTHSTNGIWDEHALGSMKEKEAELFKGIQSRIIIPKQTRIWPRVMVVAAAIGLMITGVFLFKSFNEKDQFDSPQFAHDIRPGQAGATLTLSDGKKIRLSDAANGKLAREAGVLISKTADGKLIYEIKTGNTAGNRINTISTAKGETYQLRLPDGSMVWLNAASSLTFTADLMKEGKRNVKLSGEAYFEISKDKSHPFIVKTDRQEIEVLGTHFNVNAYLDDENQITTLLEGLVKASSKTQQVLIKPGQQAVLNLSNNRLEMSKADLETVMAWKNNDFLFKDEDLASVMKKVARWYNVEVVFKDVDPKSIKLVGLVSRSKNISAVLKIVESITDLKFKIEERRITVMR
jgi:transmembrane sensor